MAPAEALSCPRCGALSQPLPEIQQCPGCALRFVLRAGALIDPTVAPPPPDPRVRQITVRWSAIFTIRLATVDAQGIAEGMADPITGFIPLDKSGVAFPDIFTVAVWRKPEVARFIVASLLPLAVLVPTVAAALTEPGFLLVAAPFLLLVLLFAYRAFVVRAHFARVVGRYRAVTVRFDRPFWRRRPFYEELMRRAGIGLGPIP
jgi:hypothetical protein